VYCILIADPVLFGMVIFLIKGRFFPLRVSENPLVNLAGIGPFTIPQTGTHQSRLVHALSGLFYPLLSGIIFNQSMQTSHFDHDDHRTMATIATQHKNTIIGPSIL
jgi:hypothetical protein